MSDRLAVFNQGRIEQLGTPIEVYERPESEFVAGFIGVSNLLERAGRRFTIRPEKLRLLDEGEAAFPDSHVEAGRIVDVVYLGMVTRFLVELESGDRLVAVRQNLETAGGDVLAEQGRSVRVAWREQQTYPIADPTGGGGGESTTDEKEGLRP